MPSKKKDLSEENWDTDVDEEPIKTNVTPVMSKPVYQNKTSFNNKSKRGGYNKRGRNAISYGTISSHSQGNMKNNSYKSFNESTSTISPESPPYLRVPGLSDLKPAEEIDGRMTMPPIRYQVLKLIFFFEQFAFIFLTVI